MSQRNRTAQSQLKIQVKNQHDTLGICVTCTQNIPKRQSGTETVLFFNDKTVSILQLLLTQLRGYFTPSFIKKPQKIYRNSYKMGFSPYQGETFNARGAQDIVRTLVKYCLCCGPTTVLHSRNFAHTLPLKRKTVRFSMGQFYTSPPPSECKKNPDLEGTLAKRQ